MRKQKLATITLVNTQGEQLLNTAVPFGTPLPAMQQADVIALAKQGASGFVDQFEGRVLGKYLVAIVVPVVRADGEQFALTAALSSENLRELITIPDIPNRWITSMVDNKGIIIARNVKSEEFEGTKAAPLFFQRVQQVSQGSMEVVTVDGVPIVSGFSRSALTGWSVGIGIPKKELNSQLINSLQLLLATVVLLVVGTLLLARAAGKRLTHSIQVLQTQADQLGKGEIIEPMSMAFHEANLMSQSLSDSSKQLNRAKESLIQRNLDLQQFAFAASHDLRVPLKTINGYLSLLKRRFGTTLEPKALDLLDRSVRAVAEMDQLTVDLLAYSRVEAGGDAFTLVNCDDLLADTLRFLEATILETGALVHVAPLPSVQGDRSQLIQLFQNLLGNALNYLSAAPPQIHVDAMRGTDEWIFSVSDNGIGIDPVHHQKIFEVFKRLHTTQEYRGNGIGLAICQRVVERHGGRLWLTSSLGKGSTFYFSIPDHQSMNP
jgi:signal transduction histidine kinase